MKGMVYDGSYYFYLLLQFSLATMITQPTSNTNLQDDVGYKSLHVLHLLTDLFKYM